MIISDKYRFVFIHIPKCAGTYVRNSIQKFDDTQGFFTSRVDYDDKLKKIIDYVHIPLEILECYFPNEYKKIISYNSFAIMRNPYERFFSSFSQYIKSTLGKQIHNLSIDDIRKQLDTAVNFLEKNRSTSLLPYNYIHFTPQVSYIKLHNHQVVKKLFGIHQTDEIFSYISRITGQKIHVADKKLNVTKVYKNDFYRIIINNINQFLRSILRHQFYKQFKTYVENNYSHLIFNSNYYNLMKSFEVEEFIDWFYSEDVKLYKDLFN